VGALADQVALALGQRAEDMEDQVPARGGRVDLLLQAAKADAAVFEPADGVDQVPQAAPEPIELPHHQRVDGPQVVEGAGELGPLGDRAARLLGEHALAARGLERVELQRGALLGR
jgi:hypothetical protein